MCEELRLRVSAGVTPDFPYIEGVFKYSDIKLCVPSEHNHEMVAIARALGTVSPWNIVASAALACMYRKSLTETGLRTARKWPPKRRLNAFERHSMLVSLPLTPQMYTPAQKRRQCWGAHLKELSASPMNFSPRFIGQLAKVRMIADYHVSTLWNRSTRR